MKKIIALLLAVVMTFSVATVAFATGETDTTTDVNTEATVPEDGTTTEDGTTDDETTEETAGELDWLLDLPFWTVGPAFKFAKIALKLVKVFVKLAMIFGIIDKDEITDQIVEMIKDAMAQQGEQESDTPETTVPETTEPIVA